MTSQTYLRLSRFIPAAAATASASWQWNSQSASSSNGVDSTTRTQKGGGRQDDDDSRMTTTTSTTTLMNAGIISHMATVARNLNIITHNTTTLCEAPEHHDKPYDGILTDPVSSADDTFHSLFPRRQLWEPRLEYPLWDTDWDGRQPPSTGDPDEDRRRMRLVRKEGVTRHIILVRHGQYDEAPKDDEQRKLTPLGREQADLTGRRLRELIEATGQGGFTPIHVKVLRVSNMARAKETADIIAKHLPGVHRSDPDSDLNEGRPAHNIPGGKASSGAIEKVDEQHPRIEAAFQRYFYRAPTPGIVDDLVDDDEDEFDVENASVARPKHEFEVIVCHANVIRYFLCRALQIPPEAWLRLCTFNCSLTYLTIRPTGSVSCRSLGDIGHLPYDKCTFSMHAGYNW